MCQDGEVMKRELVAKKVIEWKVAKDDDRKDIRLWELCSGLEPLICHGAYP